ncbi:cell wall integrity and stress response component 1-like isoform X6 [Megalobrama amblycephala]|uniref:cell wall integrity and stress response component 1-like isoform X6 n=1 Tax=Megalobrama amblycephala TaxID=75352 RepID=UPI0020142739|nr:cell wall integrity and stress response component 1-like isoform X6 [Megalobrama amblycephala]
MVPAEVNKLEIYQAPSVTESQNTSSSNIASDVATSSTTSASPSRPTNVSGPDSSDKASDVATSSTTSASPSRPSSVATSPTTSTLPSRSTASPKQTTVIVNNPINTSSPTLEPNKSITSSPTGKQSHNRTSTSHPTSQPATSKAGLGDKAMLVVSDKNYLWILVPVLIVALAAMIYLKFKCKKVQSRPEMADIGTENASFQRTDSNKDGVMLLGVSKTSVGEDNAAAR